MGNIHTVYTYKDRLVAYRVTMRDGERGVAIYRLNAYGGKIHAYTVTPASFKRLLLALLKWERRGYENYVEYLRTKYARDFNFELYV